MTAEVIRLLNSCRPTRHFRERAVERHLRRDVEEFIVTWGSDFIGEDGVHYLMIVYRDLPPGLGRSVLARRAEDWVLVVAENGAILTCYRSAKACRNIRRHAA